MKVSVITATYNHEKYIGRTLRSLLNQTLPSKHYEMIVVNDGSTDRTAKALTPFESDPRVRIFHNDKNFGLPYSINRGVRSASFKYIIRVDSDDYVNENFLNVLTMFLDYNPEFGAVCCDYVKVDEKERIMSRCSAETSPIGCGIMFRKDNLIDIGLYDENFLMHEDLDLRARYLKHFSIYRVSLPLYRYRMHEDNMTKNFEHNKIFLKKLEEKHGWQQ